MISSIKGEIMHIGENFIEVFCGDVGYKIFCSHKTAGAYSLGQEIEIFTHLHVRDDLLDLYGFKTREERDFF